MYSLLGRQSEWVANKRWLWSSCSGPMGRGWLWSLSVTRQG